MKFETSYVLRRMLDAVFKVECFYCVEKYVPHSCAFGLLCSSSVKSASFSFAMGLYIPVVDLSGARHRNIAIYIGVVETTPPLILFPFVFNPLATPILPHTQRRSHAPRTPPPPPNMPSFDLFLFPKKQQQKKPTKTKHKTKQTKNKQTKKPKIN